MSRSSRRSRPSARPATVHAVADAVHARGLRGRRTRDRPAAARAHGPDAAGRPTRSINGMFSFTPDAGSIVGESAKVRGVWICEAVWVTHGGGMGQQVAEWMAERRAVRTTWPRPTRTASTRSRPRRRTCAARGAQQYREVYDILHPLQQMTAPRKLRLTPFYERHVGARRGVLHRRGLGAPAVVRGEPRAAHRRRPGQRARAWAAANWSPAVGRRAPGDARARRRSSTSRRSRSSTCGPGCAGVPRADLREPDRPAGRHGRVHGDAHARGRDPLRPHGDPPGRGRCSGW